MKVGFIGLGKMGLPIAVSMTYKGHDVMGYDAVKETMSKAPTTYQEAGPDGSEDFNKWLEFSRIQFGSLNEVLNFAEIVFVAVQTPHHPKYEGITRMQYDRIDFNYSYLIDAVKQINAFAAKPIVVVIMSTVLPGTMRRDIMPIATNPNIKLVYSPSFIAMGTTMRDFLYPEFTLVGSDHQDALKLIKSFYNSISKAPVKTMAIESAELAKVAYNTFIGMKIVFANTIMEICECFPKADCDEVVSALKLSYRRLISSAYMNGGMGDGGGCHPRDNIALSWLAKTQGLSYDIFDSIMKCREKQAEYLANILYAEHIVTGLPIIILGTAFKPETNLVIGSPALLVAELVREKFTTAEQNVFLIDDNVGVYPISESKVPSLPGVYLIGCKHRRYQEILFEKGSVIIDPHRYIHKNDDCTVKHLGSRKE